MMLKKRCRICGSEFRVPPKQASRAYCDRDACQIERRRRDLARERRKYRLVKKGLKKVAGKSKPDQGRRCRRCGCNCYPNYFYCADCHSLVSTCGWNTSEEDSLTAP
jgi:hypothetical protein